MVELADKVVIVTGASRGIGAATARRLASEGAKVVVAARSGNALQDVAAQILREGGFAIAMACDVADHRSAARLVREVDLRFGRIDVLVNNAGAIEPIGRIDETDPHSWAGTIRTNLVGAYNMVRSVLPVMLRSGRGTIINLSSGAAFRPLEGWSAYCAAKAGLAMFTRSISHEYGAGGIRAFGLVPGVVDTAMQAQIRSSCMNPVSRLPREALVAPEEPAMAICWLCGEAADRYAGEEVDIRDPALREAIGL